jgi:flagellar protein FlgJ
MTNTLGSLPPAAAAAATALPATATAATGAANTYSDLNGLNALKTGGNSPQTLHAVAQQVDAMFLQMMLKSMRDASADAGDPQSNAMGMYEDMFDKQVSLTLSQHQDIGLGSVLTRQLGAAGSTAAGVAGAAAAAGSGTAATPATVPARSAALLKPASADDTDADAVGASPSDFVSQVMPAIRTAAAALGVSPLGILAQAALETGWGRRMPRTANGASSLNLFGIKAGGEWDGDKASATTVEFSEGVASAKRTAFRAYDSIEQSVGDFTALMSSPRYRAAINAGQTALGYVQGIASSGYATDPAYAAKLTAMLRSNTFREALSGSGVAL